MGALEQQESQQLQGSRVPNVPQQLEPSSAVLPPEEPANISQLIELDLLGDKKKNDADSSDEEVQPKIHKISRLN